MACMRAETVIATHGNTDFDALASMLAARRLYPGAGGRAARRRSTATCASSRACTPTSSTSSRRPRLELDAIRRLVVVETVARLAPRRARAGRARPGGREGRLRPPRATACPTWARAESVVLSADGALTTTLVGILAERELAVSPLEATALRARHPRGHRLAHVRLGHAARRRGARVVPAPRRAPGCSSPLPAGAALPRRSASCWPRCWSRSRPVRRRRLSTCCRRGAVAVATSSDVAHLAHKLVDLTDCARARLPRRDGGARLRRRPQPRARARRRPARRLARRRRPHERGLGDPPRVSRHEAPRACGPRSRRRPQAAPRPRRHVRARRARSRPTRRSPRPWSPASATARAGSSSSRTGSSSGRSRGGSRQGDRARARPGARQGDHELGGHDLRRAGAARPSCSGSSRPRSRVGSRSSRREGRRRRDAAAICSTRSARPRRPSEAPSRPAGRSSPRCRGCSAPSRPSPPRASAYDGVYLVGGAVRDVLLGEPSFDVDIAVEGDAIALARALARQLHGRVHPHEKFGTAVVLYGEDERVDVVTARTEFYDAPGRAAVGRARDDPRRPLPARLHDQRDGRLAQGRRLRAARRPVRGRRDVEARVLRVLHNLSFVDDPTRIFRAIRYENRLGFRMEEHTLRLARGCVEMGLVGDLSSARLRDELVALLEEGEIAHSLLRLGELGADRGGPSAPRRGRGGGRPARAGCGACGTATPRRCPTGGSGSPCSRAGSSRTRRYGWLDRLRVRRRDVDLIAAAVAVGPLLVERVRAERARSRPSSSRSPTRMRPTRRSSHLPSAMPSRCTRTSRACARCGSR